MTASASQNKKLPTFELIYFGFFHAIDGESLCGAPFWSHRDGRDDLWEKEVQYQSRSHRHWPECLPLLH